MRKLMFIMFMMMLFVMPAFAQETITPGQVVSGSIANETPEVRYLYNGTEGESITIQMIATQQGLDSYLQLLGPDGAMIAFDDDSAGNLNSMVGPIILPQTATYTIVATHCCGGGDGGGGVGPYELSVTNIEARTLSDNETSTVALGNGVNSAFFLYNTTPSQKVQLRGTVLEGTGGFIVMVRDTNSNMTINQAYGNEFMPATLDPLFLNGSGNYMISITRDVNGSPEIPQNSLSIGLTLNTFETQPLALETPVSGTLDDNNPSDYFLINVAANDLLRISGSKNEGNQDFEVAIFGQEGYSIISAATAYPQPDNTLELDPAQLPSSGEYLVVVRRIDANGNGVVGTTNYTFTIGASQAPVLQAGEEVIDTVGQFEKVYRYNGTSGQRLRITLRSVDEFYGPSMNVQGTTPSDAPMMNGGMGMGGGGGGYPGGSYIMNVNSGQPASLTFDVTLPTEGVYLFRVNNGIFSEQGGQFGLKIEIIG